MKKTVMALVVAASFGLSAETVAFYDFSEGSVGADVVSVTDQSGSGYAGTGSHDTDCGCAYSDDIPGGAGARLLPNQSLDSTPISTNWKSVEFKTNSDGTKGGCIKIPNLGFKICDMSNSSFTVECFVKIEKHRDWKNVFKWTEAVDQATYKDNQDTKLCDYDSRLGLQIDQNAPKTCNRIATNVWYHVAVVYTPPADASSRGTFRCYRNGTLYDTRSITIVGRPTSAGNHHFYLGCGDRGNECLAGKIAGVRVSEGALAPTQFLRTSAIDPVKKAALGDVIGLWTFSEGTAGQDVNAAPNAIDSADRLIGVPVPYIVSGSYKDYGKTPVYSDDVPGDRILSSTSNRTVIAENIKSAKFSSSTLYYDAGALEMRDFRSRVAQAGAFTLEYFVKYDEAVNWRDTFVTHNTSSNSFKMCNNASTTAFGYQYYTPSSSPTYQMTVSDLTAQWHHVALEWDNVTKKMCVYVDYKKGSDTSNVDFENSPYDGRFGIERGVGSNEGLCGKIACIRLTPRRLTTDEMMVVAHGGKYDGKTIFHWSFEDQAAANGATITSAEGSPVNRTEYRSTADQSNSQKATYSNEVFRANRPYVHQNHELLATNAYSAYFYGRSKIYDDTWAGSQLRLTTTADVSDIRPASFTLEMFIRRDLAANEGMGFGFSGELIASYGGQSIHKQADSTDLFIFLAGGSPHSMYFVYEDEDGTYCPVSTPVDIEDGKWHHLAVTYDDPSNTATIYVDYAAKWSKTLATKMRCTTDKDWTWTFGRGCNVSGFVGWMDDIRLSRGVRPPSEFLRRGDTPKGLAIIFK